MPSEPMEVQPVEVPVEPPAPAVSVVVPASPSVSLEAGIFLGWFVGVLVLAVLLMQRAWFVRGLIAQSKPAEGKLTDMLTDCCRELGIRKKIDLRISQNAQSPAACGLLSPKVLLPSSLLARLSSDKLRTVLLHELAHVKRGDLWVNFGQTVLQIIYFYNPLLWLANAMVRRVREQAVDEMVLAHLGDEAGSYSSTLVDIAEIAFARPVLGLRLIGVVESKKALAGRIKHILSKPFPKSAKLGILGLLVVIIAGCLLLPMAKAGKDKQAAAEHISEESHFVTTLLNGVTVELVGICKDPTKKGQKWWRPNGVTMGQPEYELKGKQAFKYPCLGYLLNFSPCEDISYESQIDLDYLFFSSGPVTKQGQAVVFWGESQPLKTALPDRVEISVKVAAGDWKMEKPHQDHVYKEFTNLPNGKVIILSGLRPNPDKRVHTKTLIDATTTEFDVDINLECMTRDGKHHKSWDEGALISKDNLVLRTFGFRPAVENIEKIYVNYRDFSKVTFRNVSLRPGVKTDVQVEVESVEAVQKVREIFLPDEDRAQMALDMAGGKLVQVPDVNSANIVSTMEELGVDLAYGANDKGDSRGLLFLRGATADRQLMRLKGLPFPVYEIAKELPDNLIVQTAKGNRFKVTILSADKDKCHLRYYLLPDETEVEVEGVTTNEADEVRYEGRTIDEWMAQWDSKVSDDIDAATNALIKIGRPAVPRLAQEVKKRTRHGSHAVGVLTKMGPEAEEALELLIEVALDKDLRFGDGRQSPYAYRATVLYSLSKMTWAKDRVTPVLQRIAEDGEEEAGVRRQVIWALMNVGKGAMPILQKLIENEDRSIRDATHSVLAQLMEEEEGLSKDDYYTPLIEKDPFGPSVLQYLWNTKGIINLGHPHPLTQKIKKLYRRRLATEPDPELAWRLATIIHRGLRNTNLEWAAPAGGGIVRSPREDPAESYATLAEVLELGFRHAQPNSQLWSKFGTALAKLRLLQGDWDHMNATLKKLGREPIPAGSRPWLSAPPVDWQDDLHNKWQVADESMRSGDCSLEFKIEKDGKGLTGVHCLVKRAPEPTNVTYTGIPSDTLFFAPYPISDSFDSFGYRGQDRPLTRYAISDESGIVRFDRLPDIPVKVEVLIPTSNFPEPVSNWDLWMEVEPGKFKIAKMYGGADAVGAGLPPAPEELRPGETVHYPRLVVRPTFRLNIEDWQRIDSDDLVLNWEGLDSLLVDRGLRYELEMSLSAPADPYLSVEHAPVIKSAKLVTKQKQWPVSARGVGGLRFEAGNIYMFEVMAIDKSGTVVARWPRTRVWVPWGYRQSNPPFTYSYIGPDRPDRQDDPPIYERVWYRYPREKVIRFIRDYPNAFEYEHALLGKAWLDWHEGDRDGARQQLHRLIKELPKGNVVRGTAIWLLQQMDENERPLKRHRRLNFVPDEY
jgi:beta-lactamase regulating signal transducer with metallopeptidase domain